MAPLQAAAAHTSPFSSSFFLFLSPPPNFKPSAHKPKSTFLCSSAPAPKPTPSLSDQLHPLSLTILQDKPTALNPIPPPKPTWVNPSKPRPSVLSLRRHARRSRSVHPSSSHLQPLIRTLRSLYDDSNLVSALDTFFPSSSPPSPADALLLLNYLHPTWQKSLALLKWLLSAKAFPVDTIFFNVTLKSLRAARQWPHVERLALDMLASGVPLDNITYSTIITAARRCRRFDKAVEWFERMYAAGGVLPDEVTYSAVLDVYAQLGKKEEVLSLFERARASGWKPDPVAFAVLAKMFGEAGDYDGIQFMLMEMRDVGVKPNVFVYNALLEALGRTGKPGLARSLFDEMTMDGVEPNARTLTALTKIYGKARWGRDALKLWEHMRANKWPADLILCNTLLSMCADLGLLAEAEQLFDDMKRHNSGIPRPDNWSYAAMINIYGSGGEAERALELFVEMLEGGLEPNIMSYTCLIQCLGKAQRIHDAVRVFEAALDRGLKPDDRLCGCLLSVVALSNGEEMEMVLACLEKANPNMVKLIRMLGNAKVGLDDLKEEFRGILNAAAAEVRRPYCNCLIDICLNQGFPSRRASELFHLGLLYGLYSRLHTKKPEEWLLDLRSLSIGAAKTAFKEWIKSVSERLAQNRELPQSFGVYTGSGTHKFAQGLASAFTTHLEQMGVPFRRSESHSGSFVTSRDDLVAWLQMSSSSAVVCG